MKKINTLKKNYEFSNVIKRGNYHVKKQIIVYITKNNKNKKYIMKGLLPLRVLLYRKNVIKVCSECEEIINFGKYFGSGWGNKNDTQI